MNETEGTFRQYLLRDLPEDETEKIDLQVISDPDSENVLTQVEDELMEDFLDGELSAAELGLFKENFLISDDRKERLRQISLLRHYAQTENKLPAITPDETAPDGFFSRLTALLALNRRPAAVLAVGLILIGAGVIIWQFAFPDRRSAEIARLETETTALNQRDLGDLDEFKNIPNLPLFVSTTRSETAGQSTLRSEELTGTILLRLALPPGSSGADKFRVKITGDQTGPITLAAVRAYTNPNGREIRLLLPKSLVARGVYQIEVFAAEDEKYPIGYSFRVN